MPVARARHQCAARAIDSERRKRERPIVTEPARSIGKLGFRKWYERRLIEGHAWLISCFLCALGIAIAFITGVYNKLVKLQGSD